jgi:hypothetical protein
MEDCLCAGHTLAAYRNRCSGGGGVEPKTEAAVRDFQQNENLSVDGIVGTQTWTALLRRWLLCRWSEEDGHAKGLARRTDSTHKTPAGCAYPAITGGRFEHTKLYCRSLALRDEPALPNR